MQPGHIVHHRARLGQSVEKRDGLVVTAPPHSVSAAVLYYAVRRIYGEALGNAYVYIRLTQMYVHRVYKSLVKEMRILLQQLRGGILIHRRAEAQQPRF